MGRMNPERWPVSVWRGKAPNIGRMIDLEWEVTALCGKCGLEMLVNLPRLQRLYGPKFVLWNRKNRCKRFRCDGWMIFQGRPPRLSWPMKLYAPSPDGEEER